MGFQGTLISEVADDMGREEAEGRFAAASKLYVDGLYEDALAILSELDAEFPGDVNLLKAKARTLAKLGRFQDAIDVCDRLESELGYEKARRFRDTLTAKARRKSKDIEVTFDPGAYDGAAVEMQAVENAENPKTRRLRVKPFRLALLVLILAGMYVGYISVRLGIAIIAAYFLVKYLILFAAGKVFTWLFSIPFRMKGKPLDGAKAELHGIEWTDKPPSTSTEDEEEDEKPAVALRYAWLDVSITPVERKQGFTHWEPGELMVAPATAKIRKLDDMDKCFRIHAIKFIADGQEIEERGEKVRGPLRIKALVEFPADTATLKLVYYGYSFGELAIR